MFACVVRCINKPSFQIFNLNLIGRLKERVKKTHDDSILEVFGNRIVRYRPKNKMINPIL